MEEETDLEELEQLSISLVQTYNTEEEELVMVTLEHQVMVEQAVEEMP